MRLRRFLDDREPSWAELEQFLARAGQRPETLGAAGVFRLGELYRQAAADLAFARRQYPGDPVVGRLEQLLRRGRQAVYGTTPAALSPLRLLTTTYWRVLASRPTPLALAALCFFGSAALACAWALADPDAAGGLVPGAFRSVVEPRPGGAGVALSPGESAALASTIFTNNIAVTAMALAFGITFGIGTIYVLVYNGALIGTLMGLAWGSGNGSDLIELVAPHGFLELTCITVAGAAGLRIGWSLVEAGPRPRLEALRLEARAAVVIVLGTAPWLIAAGLVEGFVTPRGIGTGPAIAVGLALATPYWSLLAWRGFAARSRGDATDAIGP
jgi:uncharacterized membrane protein SpoIIM required for sporulation